MVNVDSRETAGIERKFTIYLETDPVLVNFADYLGQPMLLAWSHKFEHFELLVG